MVFVNYIKYKHGKLKRGDRCLYMGQPAVYMGSYVEHHHTVDMLRVQETTVEGAIINIREFILQSEDRERITCIQQMEPAIEGQLMLC